MKLIKLENLQYFGQNLWTKIKDTFMTKEDAIDGILVGQEWTILEFVTGNTPIALPPTDSFNELYIEMYSSDGTITHQQNVRMESILFESSNTEYREILLDGIHDAQTYVKYDFATNSIIPCMYEGDEITDSSVEITTRVYTKTNNFEIGNVEAEKIVYDNSVSGMYADDVQGALDEVNRTIGYTKSYNVLPCNKVAGTWNGMTYTPVLDEDGLLLYYSLSGTRDAETYYEIYSGALPKGLEVGKTYKVTTDCVGEDSRFYMLIYQTVNGVQEEAINTRAGFDGEGALWTIQENTTNIVVRLCSVTTSMTFNDTRFYPMIKLVDIEDEGYKPYVADLNTRLEHYDFLDITSKISKSSNCHSIDYAYVKNGNVHIGGFISTSAVTTSSTWLFAINDVKYLPIHKVWGRFSYSTSSDFDKIVNVNIENNTGYVVLLNTLSNVVAFEFTYPIK